MCCAAVADRMAQVNGVEGVGRRSGGQHLHIAVGVVPAGLVPAGAAEVGKRHGLRGNVAVVAVGTIAGEQSLAM